MQNKSILLVLLLSVFTIGFSLSDAHAATFTATQSGNWNDPNTWGGAVPTVTDDVDIQSGVTVTVTESTAIGAVTNSGILILNDEFIASGTITNNGNIQQNSLVLWTLEVDLNNFNSIINNNEISFEQGITVTNSGTITNNGNIVTSAIVQTTGAFDNFGTIDNDVSGDFQNLPGSSFINRPPASIANFGFITNFDSFTNNGEIANSGTITNNIVGTFTNNNSFTFDCDGVIAGTITGIQPVQICSANPPVFTSFPADIVTSTDAGTNHATVVYPYPTAVDGNVPSDVEQIAGKPSGAQFLLGVTTNTFRASDADSQTTDQSFTVTVNDNEPPVISGIPANIVVPTDSGSSSAIVTWTLPTASDNVDGPIAPTQTAGPTPGSAFSLGTTTVTYSATDSAGNTATLSFTVTVSDSEDPMISGVPSDISIPLPFGETFIPVNWIEPTATDNIGVTSFTSTHVPGDLFFPGTTVVTYTATDTDGNITTASFNVTITSPLFIAVQNGDWNDPNTWGSQVPPDSDDKLIPTGITVSNSASFTNFGNIEILGSLINNCGASITNSGTITGTVSEILCIPNLVFPLDGSLITEEKPDLTWEANNLELRPIMFSPNLENTANLGVPIQLVSLSLISAEPVNNALDGTYAWKVFVDIAPSYNPGYSFTANTVSSSIATYAVSIIDTTPPIISGIPNDFTVIVPEGTLETQVTWIPPTATDNIDNTFFFSANILPGFTLGLGEHLVTYTAKDSSGNISTASFTITIIIADDEPPVISDIPSDITILLPTGETFIPVNWIEPTATDNIGVTSFTSTHVPGDLFFPGTTVVTYTAIDAAGNITTAFFNVTINETPVELFCGLPVEAYGSVINGTSRSDHINGTHENDLIFGLDGNDKINGLDGNDCIYGGDGNDKINGNNGIDEIHGGSGYDLIIGNNNDDKLFGDDGKDKIFGNNGDDFIDGGENSDECKGGNGSNTIINCEKRDDDHNDDHNDNKGKYNKNKGRYDNRQK